MSDLLGVRIIKSSNIYFPMYVIYGFYFCESIWFYLRNSFLFTIPLKILNPSDNDLFYLLIMLFVKAS